jgi:membrane-anchored protein YejM (alkaline phosphatase superfamily)
MTSHADLPPTVLTLLGVENPPSDYCLGYDLLGSRAREYAVLGDWSDLCYVGPRHKAEFSLQSYGFVEPAVTTRDDAPVKDAEPFLDSGRDRFALVMKDMARFTH